ncbi:MAG: hypothetical protein HY098_07780 [Nitrospinae bacterium]|nr:hypothetical protein [Nitrospinota bacterium]
MISCRETSGILASGTDPGLWKRLQLRLHLMMCDACSAYKRQLGALRKGIRKLVETESAKISGAELENQIIIKIREHKRPL